MTSDGRYQAELLACRDNNTETRAHEEEQEEEDPPLADVDAERVLHIKEVRVLMAKQLGRKTQVKSNR